MKRMRVQREVVHLRAGDNAARRVASLVQFGFDAQTGGRAGVADQLDHRLEGAERTAAPILRDVAEEAMLDLVPLARARAENARRGCAGAGRRPGVAVAASTPRER